MDDFKVVNDTEGHLRGDEVLRELGDVMRAVGRTDDRCYRYGGDEFFAIVSNCTQTQARELFCARLVQAASERLPGISLSIGIATTGPHTFVEPSGLIRAADQDMYRAKRSKKTGAELPPPVEELSPAVAVS